MQEELLPYYQTELRFIRRMAADFARKYPAEASRLELEPEKCEDPHVERLIEAFALLSARIRYKIDDEFPEITESLLGILYPHYLRPIPSMSIMQFALDEEQSSITSGYPIPRGSELRSKPVMEVEVQFKTAYPVTLWPVAVEKASFLRASSVASLLGSSNLEDKVFAAIRIELKTAGTVKFPQLDFKDLRFFLNGDSKITYTLHELIFNNAIQVLLRNPETGAFSVIERNFIGEAGYGLDEGMFPYDSRSFLGYRLLQEYFCFPQKFLFFDVLGLQNRTAVSGGRLEIYILLSEFALRERLTQLEKGVNSETFLLGCAPVVNLFERRAEAISVSETETEYRVIGDRYHESSTEVYSIERVVSSRPDTEEIIQYEPFYSFKHTYLPQPKQSTFWIASRRNSLKKDDMGSEVYLSLVDLNFRPSAPPNELLTIRVTCTNRDLPARLPITGADDEFEMASGPMVRIRCRFRPTETLRPSLGNGLQWRLISHLALNGLSIVNGREALQELLQIYDFSDDPVVRSQISGITAVNSGPQVARIASENGPVMCMGTRVEMEFDEDQFVGTSAFLMACVLERFLGLYSATNSFSQLSAKTRQRRGLLKQWPPRSGDQILL